jgi:hypothetical protein
MGMAPPSVQMVNIDEGTAPTHISWVCNLLQLGTELPASVIERTAAALCRSLRPSTLGDYIRFATTCETFMGAPLPTWIDMDDCSLHALVTCMLA